MAMKATAYGLTLRFRKRLFYARYWAGHRPVEVTISENEIQIRRTGERQYLCKRPD